MTVLATSREQLGVTGEVAWRVPSLPSPPDRRAFRRSRRCRSTTPSTCSSTGRDGPDPSFAVNDVERARHRADLPSSRRHPVGGGAGRGPLPAPEHRADRGRARRPVPLADRRTAHGVAPPADAGRLGRMELRPPRRCGAPGAAPARGVRRARSRSERPRPSSRRRATWTRSRCSTRSAASSTRAWCSCDESDDPETRSLPAARDDPRVRGQPRPRRRRARRVADAHAGLVVRTRRGPARHRPDRRRDRNGGREP